MKKRHGKKQRINTTIDDADARAIQNSRYTYADAIRYFAEKLRTEKGIIFEADLELLEEEEEKLLLKLASKKSDAKKLKAKLIKIEAEVEAIERRLLRVKQKRYKFEEILEKQGPIEDRPLEEAYRFIMTRLEDWRKRGHYVTPTSFRNDRGQDLVDLAVEFYGVPRDEVVDKLRREGIEL